jgi:hypothetical protein
MRRGLLTLVAVFCFCGFPIYSQYEKPAEKPAQKPSERPDELVQEWFKRLNALNGKDDTVKALIDLYQPDALQQVGPSEEQFGQVFYNNRRQLEKWARDFAQTHVPIPEVNYFSIQVQTNDEKTSEVYYTTQTPWGDNGASVEFTGRYLNPDNKKGYVVFGAAFFQFHNGKISRLRLYMPREEIMEIQPPFKT